MLEDHGPGLALGVQSFDLEVGVGGIEHGEQADGVAVFEPCAEGGVGVDAFDLGLVLFDGGGIWLSERETREFATEEVVRYQLALGCSTSCDDGLKGIFTTS